MPVLAELDDPGKLFRISGSGVAVRLPIIVEQTFLRQPAIVLGTPDEKIRFKRGQILEIFRMKAGKQSLRMIGTQQIFTFQRNWRISKRRCISSLSNEQFAQIFVQRLPFGNGDTTKLPVPNELLQEFFCGGHENLSTHPAINLQEVFHFSSYLTCNGIRI